MMPNIPGDLNRNDDAPLRMPLAADGEPVSLRVWVSDDLSRHAARVKAVSLRLAGAAAERPGGKAQGQFELWNVSCPGTFGWEGITGSGQ